MRTQKHGKMKIIVNENEKGLLFKNGRFIRILDAGKYICLGGKKIEKLPLNAPVVSSTAALETLMTNDSFRENVTVFDVPEGFIALEFTDGYFVRCHRSGRYAFWNNFCEREMRLEDLSTPKEADYISKYEIPTCLYTKFEVESHELGCLYFDGVFKYILEPGVYYYWNGPVHIECRKTDMRPRSSRCRILASMHGERIKRMRTSARRYSWMHVKSACIPKRSADRFS